MIGIAAAAFRGRAPPIGQNLLIGRERADIIGRLQLEVADLLKSARELLLPVIRIGAGAELLEAHLDLKHLRLVLGGLLRLARLLVGGCELLEHEFLHAEKLSIVRRLLHRAIERVADLIEDLLAALRRHALDVAQSSRDVGDKLVGDVEIALGPPFGL